LVNDDCSGQYAVLETPEGEILELSIHLDCYPGLSLTCLGKKTPAMMKGIAKLIRTSYKGWTARRMNIEGVKLTHKGEVTGRSR
jgi:hypothetical protein